MACVQVLIKHVKYVKHDSEQGGPYSYSGNCTLLCVSII